VLAPAAAATASNGDSFAVPLTRRSSSRGHSNASPASPPKPKVPTGGFYGSDYGTTAIIAIVQDSTLYVACVGDSRCMVLQRDRARAPSSNASAAASSVASPASTPNSSSDDWGIVYESEEHNCDDPRERARVEAEGGALHWTGKEYRVYPNSLDLQEARSQQLTINMSRSLGHIKLGM
jgi:hypothetical protein